MLASVLRCFFLMVPQNSATTAWYQDVVPKGRGVCTSVTAGTIFEGTHKPLELWVIDHRPRVWRERPERRARAGGRQLQDRMGLASQVPSCDGPAWTREALRRSRCRRNVRGREEEGGRGRYTDRIGGGRSPHARGRQKHPVTGGMKGIPPWLYSQPPVRDRSSTSACENPQPVSCRGHPRLNLRIPVLPQLDDL
jgi:hypothetical protein